MLDHLAACGHVVRDRSERDRRVVVSRLTPQGRRKIEAKREEWQDRWETALADVGPEDLKAATRVLERLAEMFEAAAPGDGCGVAKSRSQKASQPPLG
jgi:DNA-binding MarR family transcriptional regulator